jgi:hypothetical protein
MFSEQDNRAVYDIWHRLVTRFGQGSGDTAVGWLRHPDGSARIDWTDLCEFMQGSGFVWVDPRSPKPLDARDKDPSNRGIRLAYGAVPPLHLIHSADPAVQSRGISGYPAAPEKPPRSKSPSFANRLFGLK